MSANEVRRTPANRLRVAQKMLRYLEDYDKDVIVVEKLCKDMAYDDDYFLEMYHFYIGDES